MLNEGAWIGILNRLRHYAHRLVRNHADAEDLVQDTAQVTIRKFSKEKDLAERSDDEAFVGAYAGGVLYNITRMYRRRLKTENGKQIHLDEKRDIAQQAEAHAICERNELLTHLENIISELDDEDKELYRLFRNKLSSKEICRKLKIDSDTLRKRRQRLIRRVRRELQKRRK